jgi:hypothetical protein
LKTLSNEHLHYQHSSANITSIRGTKSKRKRKARECDMLETEKNANMILVGKPLGNRSLRRPGSK